LVFSTVHTNDAASAITRLVDMGVEPFLVASSLMAMMAQRLVRRVCQHCREAYQPTAEELKEVGLTPADVARAGNPTIYRAKGCDACGGSGHPGRAGNYELLLVGDDNPPLTPKKLGSSNIKRSGVHRGGRA